MTRNSKGSGKTNRLLQGLRSILSSLLSERTRLTITFSIGSLGLVEKGRKKKKKKKEEKTRDVLLLLVNTLHFLFVDKDTCYCYACHQRRHDYKR